WVVAPRSESKAVRQSAVQCSSFSKVGATAGTKKRPTSPSIDARQSAAGCQETARAPAGAVTDNHSPAVLLPRMPSCRSRRSQKVGEARHASPRAARGAPAREDAPAVDRPVAVALLRPA